MAVTDYIAATGDNGRVHIIWNAVDGATQYRIRRNDGTGWVNYKDLTDTSYTDTAVTNGTTYSYAVYSYVDGAWGGASAIVSATPSTAPQNLKAKIGNGKITLTWNAVTGATQYRIRRNDGAAWVNYADLTATTYTDTAVTNGTTYKYAVYAYVDGAFGSASEVISSTPSSAADGPVLYCNEGGTRYVQEVVTVNEGGTRYTLDTIIANEGGTRYEIYRRASEYSMLEVSGRNLTAADTLEYIINDTPPASINLSAEGNAEAIANIALQGLQEGDLVEMTLTYYRDGESWYAYLNGYGWSNITSDLPYSYGITNDPTDYIALYKDVSNTQYSLAFTATSDEVGLNLNIDQTEATRVILYIYSIKVNGEERLFIN